ncbi:MAG TPA: histidine phosphatase family protein [Polyangia bacterium]|jgi:phosphohistidine phosphatase
MRLLFIRHAIAIAASGGMRDEDRPLTPEGEQRFTQTARMVARVAQKPTAMLTSPHVRAQQTAAIAAQAWGDMRPIVVPALAAGDWPGICRALASYKGDDTIALVGHEGWMSMVTARLLGSRNQRAFDYRKGGAALIEVEDLPACKGTLLWFIPPRVFRRMDAIPR